MRRCSAPLLRHVRHLCPTDSIHPTASRYVRSHNGRRLAHIATRAQEYDYRRVSGTRKAESHGGQHESKPEDLVQQTLARLPTRFRADRASLNSSSNADSPSNVQALGQLLLEGTTLAQPRIDILYSLAVEHGQWKAAVWIVQRLLEESHDNAFSGLRTSQLVSIDPSMQSWRSLTQNPIEYGTVEGSVQSISMNSLIGPEDVTQFDPHSQHNHRVLGCIWRSLGLMTLACVRDKSIANGFVKPEILEMLALFHHHGFMPESVYTYVPSDQPDAVQQPATLHLLSQHIMVALSDAAWRGRESRALDVTDVSVSSTRLEKLSPAVRANIKAVKAEMWLELILWSCIHGGWKEPGAFVLLAVCKETSPLWSPMSWRKTLCDYFDVNQTQDVDWTELATAFGFGREVKHDLDVIQIERTLSSELVNAYVEVAIDSTIDDTGSRRLPPGRVFRHLEAYRKFLKRGGLNLHSGTWDSIILRMIENNPALVNRADMMNEFVHLSPTMGDELPAKAEQAKPRHVLDANASLLGLLHRSLQTHIDNSNLPGSLHVLNLVRKCVDTTKQRSIEDFFRSRLLDDEPESGDGFTSEPKDGTTSPSKQSEFDRYFRGVDHPLFEHQIPIATISALVDLITQAGARAYRRVLINEHDVEGQLLERAQFGHPQLAPALIRFATTIKDDKLVSEVVKSRREYIASQDRRPSHLDPVISSILSEQFITKQWHIAREILSTITSNPRLMLSGQCLADLAGVLLKLDLEQEQSSHQKHAWKLLQEMTVGQFSPYYRTQSILVDQQTDIVGMLAIIDKRFVSLARDLIRQDYVSPPHITAFNAILDAVAVTKGSQAARGLLDSFRNVQRSDHDTHTLQKRSFAIKDSTDHVLTLRYPLPHNTTSYTIVLGKALQEFKQNAGDHSASLTQQLDKPTTETVHWAVQGMLGNEDEVSMSTVQDINMEVHRLLEELGLTSLRLDITAMLM